MPKLIQRRRTKGWRKPEGAVSVTRPSRYGNPFEVKVFGIALSLHLFYNAIHGFWAPAGVPEELIYKAHSAHVTFQKRFRPHGPRFEIEYELKGVDIMCWCGDWIPGEPEIDCHGVLVLKMANGIGDE